jgi:hypothetical protein
MVKAKKLNTELPNGCSWHNPSGLTPEQVGEGWRLCLKEEPGIIDCCQFYDDWDRSWSSTNTYSKYGLDRGKYGTLRVRNYRPFMLRKEKND